MSPAPFANRAGATQAPAPRARFLFLQGPVGPFFSDLAQRLSPSGEGIHRIHFNGGDVAWWGFGAATTARFRGSLEREWRDFLRLHLARWDITDVVLFGDCRPLHRVAVAAARLRGLRVHVFEEGYLRPDWVTLEAGGVNGHSSLPRDAEWFRQAARALPDSGEAPQIVPSSFARRAAEDVMYTLSLAALTFRYPGFRTHRPWHPLREYAAGARRFPQRPQRRRLAAEICTRLLSQGQPFHLFPLQLQADAQIRFHSPYGDMVRPIREVIASFARHAAGDTRLVLTEHPLDQGVIDLRAVAQASAAEHGIADRLDFIPGGSPLELIKASRSVVTVNSTLGIVALGLERPVIALGDAIYGLAGLVFQGDLDRFWQAGTAPDPVLYRDFRRVVLARTQVNGGFYSPAARRLAVAGSAARIRAAVLEGPPVLSSSVASSGRKKAASASPVEMDAAS